MVGDDIFRRAFEVATSFASPRRMRRTFPVPAVIPAVLALFLWPGTTRAEESETSIGEATRDGNGFLVHAVTSPYQSGTTDIRVLLPDRPTPARRSPVVYVLPVERGRGTQAGDGLLEVKKADLHNRYGVVCVAPSFSHVPWYADHSTDPTIRQETHFLEVVVPFVEKTYPVRASSDGRLLLGFSKSGWGAFSLLLRHPDRFGKAAAWDAPMTRESLEKFQMAPVFGSLENLRNYQITRLLEKRAGQLRSRERLVLLGYGNFREHHRALHEQLEKLRIPHAYRDGPERRHHWRSGWLEEAVGFLVRGAVRTTAGRVKVFLLAGQSNMEGQAVVDLDHEKHYNGGRGTLERLMKDPEKGRLFRHLKDGRGEWVVRDDVRVWYRPGRGQVKAGRLSIGYAVYPGRHHFGPELQFGHVIGDHLEEPVLLIKTAWGGKSLFKDFRPPSSGGDVGPYYTKMVAEIREVLGDLERHFPVFGGSGHEIVGLVWFQGWNDMIDEQAVSEYEANLVNLIGDLRKELGTPDLPVVIAETGNCDNMRFRGAQAAVARRPELAGTVAFVETAAFRRPAKESPNVGHGHHWFGNAESYFLIGEAMGEAMKGLLTKTEERGTKAPSDSGRSGSVRVGAAKVDITPTHPVLLAGYGSRKAEHEGVDTPLFARALALGDEHPAVLIAVDNCGVPAPVTKTVKKRLSETTGVDGDRVVVCSTHTHCAPTLTGYAPILWEGRATREQESRVARYTERLTGLLVDVATRALASRRPARLAWGRGRVTFGGNRRLIEDGKWRGFGFQRTGPVDHSLPVLVATSGDGSPVAVWATYACHSTTLGSRNRICGDWAGFASAALESRHPGAVALTTIGCGADVGPVPSGGLDEARAHGSSIADEVDRLLGRGLQPLPGVPDVRTRTLRLPLETPPSRDELEKLSGRRGFEGVHARAMLRLLDRDGRLPTDVALPLATWTFDDRLAIVFLGGEVVVDYAVRLKRELDWRRLWINGWSDDVPCYIPSRRVLEEGGYEADFSMVYYAQPTRFAPAVEDVIVSAVKELLQGRFSPPEGSAPSPFHVHPLAER